MLRQLARHQASYYTCGLYFLLRNSVTTFDFDNAFEALTGHECFPWQRELAAPDVCGNRLIRIPTGFGKTLGVLAAWVYHRVYLGDKRWPRRLVWCLPMRVLVEQTENAARAALGSLGALWDEKSPHDDKVGVHLLMGGAEDSRWYLYPEHNAVLIGTQDMLLSRALNRGYASPRARWPMEFGLLNQDALWVLDEVQLMDVGLATSAQLQAFRDDDGKNSKEVTKPCFSWWMSATLQHAWLDKSPDTDSLAKDLSDPNRNHAVEKDGRVGHLWDDVEKSLETAPFDSAKNLAESISMRHREHGLGENGPTLVVVNTVDRAVEIWRALRKDKNLAGADIRLVHSRFRPAERAKWRGEFLNREACESGASRIVVATQVVEAGVDFSAFLLVTELAPWPSLVQRFGRCARWGGKGTVVVADLGHDSDKKAAPYTIEQLDAAREACNTTAGASPLNLEEFEERCGNDLLSRLYPYAPEHLLLRRELDELFDTSPDLSGADIDISRFIRSGDERDVQVFWIDIDGNPAPDIKPKRDELCNVPFLKAREWLCGTGKGERLKEGTHAWVWSWLDRKWRVVGRRDMYPGQTILVASKVGGYSPESGWDAKAKGAVASVVAPDSEPDSRMRPCWKRNGELGEKKSRAFPPAESADAAEDDESLSVADGWQTIADHGLQVGSEIRRIAKELGLANRMTNLLHLAGRWHDLGKAHPAFQGSIKAEDRPAGSDIAKAPDRAWPCAPQNMYRISENDQRRGFRHELASTLGLFNVLMRHHPDHPALLGPWRELLDSAGMNDPAETADSEAAAQPTAVEREILDLAADEFDLIAYLVCAHHGKVRMTWHASPADQESGSSKLRIRGVLDGDTLPETELAAADGTIHQLPPAKLDLSPSAMGLSPRMGKSWNERALGLVGRFGPFTLAWLETILRAADQRASASVNGGIMAADIAEDTSS